MSKCKHDWNFIEKRDIKRRGYLHDGIEYVFHCRKCVEIETKYQINSIEKEWFE